MPYSLEKGLLIFHIGELDRVIGKELLVAIIQIPTKEIVIMATLHCDGGTKFIISPQFIHIIKYYQLTNMSIDRICYSLTLFMKLIPHHSLQHKRESVSNFKCIIVFASSIQIINE
jgi:hypothetical protein